jgi:hypothetical protein
MQEIQGDFWEIVGTAEPSIICVTTNGIVKNNGELVMGAGIARQFAERFPELPHELGERVNHTGNIVFHLVYPPCKHTIASFPTKHDWRGSSNLSLVKRSATHLKNLTTKLNRNLYTVRPGCGNGHLNWERQVKPILKEVGWDDRFFIISPEEK